MRIRKKITLTFVTILFITLLITNLVSYVIVKKDIIQLTLNHLRSISAIQFDRLGNINEHNLERLKLVSSRTHLRLSLNRHNKNPQKQLQTRMNKILKDARLSIPEFKVISVINLDGVIVASTDIDNIGTKHKTKDYFSRGQKKNITNLFFLDKNRNLNINLCGPFILEKKLIGVLLITASADKITEFITDHSFLGETGYSLLVLKTDKKDKFIISPRRINGETGQYAYTNYQDLGEISKKTIAQQNGTYKFINDYLMESMYAVIKYHDTLDIGISVRINQDEILKPVVRFRNLMVILSSISLLIMFISSYLSAKSLTRPVRKLTDITDKISRGDLEQKIDITSKDEIALLSNSFNLMAVNLKKDIDKRKQTEEVLKKHQDHLEELVKERTAELEKANKELKRFNKLFVGREFRIKELKDKVKELEKELRRKK